jgi:hypothetical protein
MFTHLSEWKSRVEIDQRAREGRLRQEWREAPHENKRLSIPVIFWSVLGLVAQSVESLLKPPHSSGATRHNRGRSLSAFASGPDAEEHSRRDPPGATEGVTSPRRGWSENPSRYRQDYEPPRAGWYRRR